MERLFARLTPRLPFVLAGLLVLFLALAGWQLAGWAQAFQHNRALADGTLVRHVLDPRDTRSAYAAGWFHARQGHFREAVRALTLAETSSDPALRAAARYALGNLYFDIGLKVADIQSGQGHLHGLAQIELAREAYRSAIRANPALREARYNLELIDRLSPPKRVEGWERETDGVTLVPQKRDGWSSMKDNVLRGLP